MKRLLQIFLLILSLLMISAVRDTSAGKNNLYFLGITSRTNMSVEQIRSINSIIQEDLFSRLGDDMNLTDLSEAYLYSTATDVTSVSDAGRARWVLYAEAVLPEGAERVDLALNLFDSYRKDTETVKIRTTGGDQTGIRNALEFLYSVIGENSCFFIEKNKANKAGRSLPEPSYSRVLFLKFMLNENIPSNFSTVHTGVKEAFFSREKGAPSQVEKEKMRFIDLLAKNYDSPSRLAAAGRASDAGWVITGRLDRKTEAGNIRCTVNLFDVRKGCTADSAEVYAADYDSMEAELKKAMEQLILRISAENGYAYHIEKLSDADMRIPENCGFSVQDLSGMCFDGTELVCAGKGSVVKFSEEKCTCLIRAEGQGIKYFSDTAGIFTDQFGRIYIMNREERKILVWFRDGSFLNEFFYGPSDADCFLASSGGYVFIPDRKNKSVQIYTKEGSHIRDIEVSSDMLSMCLFRGNPVIISRGEKNCSLTYLSQNGTWLRSRDLLFSGETLSPDAAFMDGSENLYALDRSKNLMFCVSRNGSVTWVRKLSGTYKRPPVITGDFSGNRLLLPDAQEDRILVIKNSSSGNSISK